MFGPLKNHPYNLMGFFATKPSFIEIKHLLVEFKTISAVLLSMIQLSIYLVLNNLIEISKKNTYIYKLAKLARIKISKKNERHIAIYLNILMHCVAAT